MAQRTPSTQRKLDLTDVRIAARDLTRQQVRKVLRDGLTTTTHIAPSLLDQLRDATATGGERRTGSSGGSTGSPVPIDVTATDASIRIHDAAVALLRDVHGDDPAALIRTIVSIVGTWSDEEAVHRVARELRSWVTLITDTLDPPRRIHLAAACPACSVRMVWREQDDGDVVQVPALTITPDAGCLCQACQHTWPTTHLEHLARVLDAPSPQVDTQGEQTAC